MAIQLDHVIVSAHNRDASAKLLAHLLGVPCAPLKKALSSQSTSTTV